MSPRTPGPAGPAEPPTSARARWPGRRRGRGPDVDPPATDPTTDPVTAASAGPPDEPTAQPSTDPAPDPAGDARPATGPRRTVLLLHPGAMGSALGAQLVRAGHAVRWDPTGCSAATAARARDAGLVAQPLADAAAEVDVVLASCAPQGALDLAHAVAAAGFTGLYVEANPLAPDTLREAASALWPALVADAAVIGPPPRGTGRTDLLLAGPGADAAAALFAGTDVQVVRAGAELGAASALKAAFALYSKGRQALAALAQQLAVHHGLQPLLTDQSTRRDMAVLAEADLRLELAERAWRWGPEFDELAQTLADAGLDPALALAVRDAWRRLGPEA